ncbi:hypothetical protein GCM10011515_02210 [Tsuneonella deserti]|uniref:DUF2059 domain-containing protein n=1 Tax=Tsuneonella deserti TaxID=2035528 RepID=A0ABQ1S054_9SPHN|nr:hypothetical protein [Tsuneonella deserti]GGD86142.1 hypothetical protein GCM10011515_02210 [Tsuneonella deserti]
MRPIIAGIVLAALFAPLPLAAQDDPEAAAARTAEALRDPVLQQQMADGMAAASEALLDLPLAPLARAVAEAAGEDPRAVDPDLTLRRASPEARDVPAEIHDKLPRAMGAMAGMAGGFSAMMPALREMAERMRDAVEQAGLPD